MPAGDIYQLEVVATAAGEYVENVMHLRLTGGDLDLDPLQIASDCISAWITGVQDEWMACFSADYGLLGYRCRRVKTTGGPTAFTSTPGIVGGVAGTNDAACIGAVLLNSYQDVPTGKWRSGRIFMPSAPTAWILSNIIQPDYITALIALTLAMQASLSGTEGTDWYTGTYSRMHGSIAPPTGAPNWYISGKVGVQRRRLKPAL